MIDLPNILTQLAERRPIFHFEADFKYSLAWHIHQQHPDYSIRLEYKPSFINKRIYIDIWIADGQSIYVIEAKYKTRALQINFHDEPFDLLEQSAQDGGRYDFLVDVERLEKLVSANHRVVGLAVFLSNDRTYWNEPRRNDTIDAAFRIHQGRNVHGELRWHERAANGTTQGRESAINIQGSYDFNWADYSNPTQNRNGLFRYVIVNVVGNGLGG